MYACKYYFTPVQRFFFFKKNLLLLIFCFLSITKTGTTLTCWRVRACGNTKSGNVRFRSTEQYFPLNNPMYGIPRINSLKRHGIRNTFKYLPIFCAPVFSCFDTFKRALYTYDRVYFWLKNHSCSAMRNDCHGFCYTIGTDTFFWRFAQRK